MSLIFVAKSNLLEYITINLLPENTIIEYKKLNPIWCWSWWGRYTIWPHVCYSDILELKIPFDEKIILITLQHKAYIQLFLFLTMIILMLSFGTKYIKTNN